jgi:nucleotide-binding universal stress UspA family protein
LNYLSAERERASAEKALNEALDHLDVVVSPTAVDVLEGEPRSVILRQADKIGADLIVVAASGHGRLHEILLGSVANHISHAATCSVLIVKS